jgi:hypothetical protein
MRQDYTKLNKKGGCGRSLLGLVIAGVAGFCALVLVIAGLDMLGIIESEEGERDNAVVVLPSRTPVGEATVTPIPLPSETPAPSDTPDPVAVLRSVADGVVIGAIEEVIINPAGGVVIRYAMGQGFGGYDVGFAEDEMVHLACVLRDAGYTGGNYQFHALVNFVDDFGNTNLGDGLVIRLMPDAIAAINCDAYASVNLQAISQYYELAEGLR